jgi:double-stranded uracil-DNA glycosylase
MLQDVLTYDLDIVFCGTAKGEASARLGYYYAGPGNKFYAILHKAGFTPTQLKPIACYDIGKYGIGLTDLVHNQAGNDKAIKKENYDVAGFIAKMEKYQPRIIGFTSKAAASFALGFEGKTGHLDYGQYPKKIAGSHVFVLPSTSGSARAYWDESYWLELKHFVEKQVNK